MSYLHCTIHTRQALQATWRQLTAVHSTTRPVSYNPQEKYVNIKMWPHFFLPQVASCDMDHIFVCLKKPCMHIFSWWAGSYSSRLLTMPLETQHRVLLCLENVPLYLTNCSCMPNTVIALYHGLYVYCKSVGQNSFIAWTFFYLEFYIPGTTISHVIEEKNKFNWTLNWLAILL